MLVFKDGQVKPFKEMFPRTSFPASGPSDDFLAEQGAVKVNLFKNHDRATQKLVSCAPYVEGGWAYTVEVQDKTEDEINAETASKAAKVRATRDQLLKQSDWMVIRAQETGIAIDEDWAAYRQALRDITEQESFPDVEWPRDPDYVEMGDVQL